MNGFFELCCENYEIKEKKLSDPFENGQQFEKYEQYERAFSSKQSNIDFVGKEGSLKISSNSRLKKGRVNTITPGISPQTMTMGTSSKVDWFKNPMYSIASENTISHTLSSKIKKTNKNKKSDKNLNNTPTSTLNGIL